jgi:hypothetical protein
MDRRLRALELTLAGYKSSGRTYTVFCDACGMYTEHTYWSSDHNGTYVCRTCGTNNVPIWFEYDVDWWYDELH